MSGTTYRRSLQDRQAEVFAREAEILKVARRLLKRQGYIGLTMDRIAAACKLSKATLYRHFTSKEEVIMGLAIENARQRVIYTQKAADFPGRPREQFVAVRMFAQRIYPAHLEVELILYTNSIRAKTSADLQEALFEQEAEVFRLMTLIVERGVEARDLVLPPGATPQDLAFSAWSLYFGGFALRQSGIPLERCMSVPGAAGAWGDQDDFLPRYASAALDGLGWKPLSNEWDYGGTQARIAAAFPDDFKP